MPRFITLLGLLSFSITSSAQTFMQRLTLEGGKQASLNYDGTNLTYENGSAKYNWKLDSTVAERVQVDSMIVSAYLRNKGSVDLPTGDNVSSEDLLKAIQTAKTKAMDSIKDPAARSLISQLEQILGQERTQLRMCQYAAKTSALNAKQRDEMSKLLIEMQKQVKPGYGLPPTGGTTQPAGAGR